MSRKKAIVQGILAGIAFGGGVISSDTSEARYDEFLSREDNSRRTEYVSEVIVADIISLGFYAAAGGLAIAAIGNATRREED